MLKWPIGYLHFKKLCDIALPKPLPKDIRPCLRLVIERGATSIAKPGTRLDSARFVGRLFGRQTDEASFSCTCIVSCTTVRRRSSPSVFCGLLLCYGKPRTHPRMHAASCKGASGFAVARYEMFNDGGTDVSPTDRRTNCKSGWRERASPCMRWNWVGVSSPVFPEGPRGLFADSVRDNREPNLPCIDSSVYDLHLPIPSGEGRLTPTLDSVYYPLHFLDLAIATLLHRHHNPKRSDLARPGNIFLKGDQPTFTRVVFDNIFFCR